MACEPPVLASVTERFLELKAGLDVRAAGRISSATGRFSPTGIAGLDEALGGGLIPGAVAAFEGVGSCGRSAVCARILAQATAHGVAAVVDDGTLYPPDLVRAGVRLERLAIVPCAKPLGVARAVDILLRSRAFAVVAMPEVPLKSTVWSRLCGLAQKADAILLVGAERVANELAYFASTRVQCALQRVLWTNASGIFCELAGYDISARIVKHRRAAPGAIARIRVLARSGTARERVLPERRGAMRLVR